MEAYAIGMAVTAISIPVAFGMALACLNGVLYLVRGGRRR
jgi:hypothetical protein